MSDDDKAILLTLIDGLSKYKSVSQYDDYGEKFIDQQGIDVLKTAIRRL